MIFLNVYIILGLASLSFAQLDIQQLFQVDINTNNNGGCGYVGQSRLNHLLTDCIQLADGLIAAVDDSQNKISPLYEPAQRLLTAFFKPINWALNSNYIKCIFFYL